MKIKMQLAEKTNKQSLIINGIIFVKKNLILGVTKYRISFKEKVYVHLNIKFQIRITFKLKLRR